MDGYITAVKVNGRVLRESHGNVYLPFDTEYSLLLKNKNSNRAIVSIFIDGTDVLGGEELILPGYGGEINLERFMIDGDLHSGRKFKFVSIDNPEVADPTNSENGEIKIIFWPERQITPIYYHPPLWKRYPNPIELWNTRTIIGDTTANYSSSSNTHTLTNMKNINHCVPSEQGATIEGAQSDQTFTTVMSNGKGYPSTIIRLKLNQSKQITTTGTKMFCSKCGIRISYNDNYCSSCGQELS
jgi:hypothetical protein